MTRYPRPSSLSYSFGPGPMTPAVKWIIWANIGRSSRRVVYRDLIYVLGLTPADVIQRLLAVAARHLHVHARRPTHILFNMLGIWMFGVELERMWGTQFFLRYYAVTGIGAAITTIVVALLPFAIDGADLQDRHRRRVGRALRHSAGVRAVFPDRPILMALLFPIPAKYFVIIIGALSYFSSPGGVAHAAHLGGVIFGYLYLQGGRGGLTAEINYRYLKWKMNRLRRKFDVYSGGRSDWDRKVH